MGGYVGKCVVVFEPTKETYDYCFDAYVWHDGSFPFKDDDGDPVRIHHCSPVQFRGFGDFVSNKQKEHA